MGLLKNTINVKNSATAGEKKVTGGLARKFDAHMRHEPHMDTWEYAKDKNPVKDYGNWHSQVHTEK